MENFSPNGFSLNGKEPKIKNIEESLAKSLEDFVKGNLNIDNIGEISTENEIKICFSFKGGGKEIFEKVNDIYQKITSDPKIPEILKENFSIELDGNRKCFVAGLHIDKNHPNFETLKETAKQILEEIKEKLNQTDN
jgi:hypothetical protein